MLLKNTIVMSEFDSAKPTRSRKVVAGLGLVAAVVVPLCMLYIMNATSYEAPLRIGDLVPEVRVLSLDSGLPILIGAKGRQSQAVLFFTTECAHCQRELVNFETLYRRHNQEARFIAVSLSDSLKTLEFLRSGRFTVPRALDKANKGRLLYRVSRIPALFLVDADGILRVLRFGETSVEADEETLLTFLGKKTQDAI
jgi:peroxiredoxin